MKSHSRFYFSLYRKDIDVDKRNKGGWTALMYACYIGHESIVSLLLEHTASVNLRNSKKETSLMLAASCGNDRVGRLLCSVSYLLSEWCISPGPQECVDFTVVSIQFVFKYQNLSVFKELAETHFHILKGKSIHCFDAWYNIVFWQIHVLLFAR